MDQKEGRANKQRKTVHKLQTNEKQHKQFALP